MILFIQIILGVFLGLLFGFIPSIHINVIGYLIVILGVFKFNLDFLFFLSFALSQLITSIIPSILFGVPSDETIAILFPGQKMFLKGEAKQALILCFVGYFLGIFFSILFLPILFLLFSLLSTFYFLIIFSILFVLFLFIFEQKNIYSKVIVFSIIVLAGGLGFATLKYNYFFKDPIFVCVFGLFAAPNLLLSIFSNKKIKQQKDTGVFTFKKPYLNSFFGSLSSLFVILIPSLSSAQSSLIVSKIRKKLSLQEYLILFSSVSISTLIYSFFLTLFFKKTRLGFLALLLANKIPTPSTNVFLFVATILFSVCFTILILLLILDFVFNFVNKLNYFYVNLFVFIFSIILIILVSGCSAIFLLIVSILIGFLPLLFKKPRVILMAYVMIPTLFYFF